MKFDTTPLTESVITAVARELLNHGNDTAQMLVSRYRDAYARLWHRDDFTTADAQAVIDALGVNAIPALQANAAMGQMIAYVLPGSLEEWELATPVAYTITEQGRIVLDPEATYPGPREAYVAALAAAALALTQEEEIETAEPEPEAPAEEPTP